MPQVQSSPVLARAECPQEDLDLLLVVPTDVRVVPFHCLQVTSALPPRGRSCHLGQEWALVRPWALYQEIVTVLSRYPGGSSSTSCPGCAALFFYVFLGNLFDDGFPREDLLGRESKFSHQHVYFPQRVFGCLFSGLRNRYIQLRALCQKVLQCRCHRFKFFRGIPPVTGLSRYDQYEVMFDGQVQCQPSQLRHAPK